MRMANLKIFKKPVTPDENLELNKSLNLIN